MPVPQFGRINDYGTITPAAGPSDYEDRLSAVCDDMYNLVGSEVYECGPDKQWNGTNPTCVRMYKPNI